MTKHTGQDRDDVALERSEVRGKQTDLSPKPPNLVYGLAGGRSCGEYRVGIYIVFDLNESNGIIGVATLAGIMLSFRIWIYILKQCY